METQKNVILKLAGFTIIGMPFVAYLIDVFSESVVLTERLVMGDGFLFQLAAGIGVGLVASLFAIFIVNRPFMQEVSIKYNEMIADLKLNKSEIIFISFCAGFGEEILFRGALQPLLGLVLTSVIFVAIHGYLSVKDWRISIYGVFMTFVIMVLGYMTETIGIWSAVAAHTVIDIVLLLQLERTSTTSE